MTPEAGGGPGGPVFDAAVIGGGPAGLSAASWLGRYRRSVVVIDSEEYRNAGVDVSHGYLGSDPVPPVIKVNWSRTPEAPSTRRFWKETVG